MTFFNKKEEVLEIQLTQFGKYLLSKGKFKPVFYSFSDDEILYDQAYAFEDSQYTVPELSGRAHERIQNTTPRLRPIYEHGGAESRVLQRNGHVVRARRGDYRGTRTGLINKITTDELYNKDPIDTIRMGADDRNLIRNLLGTSELGNQNSPAWFVVSLNEEEFEQPIQMSSSSPNIGFRSPILEMQVDYEIKSIDITEEISLDQYKMQNSSEKEIFFTDNVRFSIDEDNILLDIEEKNVDFKKENFEVEFFIVEQTNTLVRDSGTIEEEILKKLYIKTDDELPDKIDNIETYLEVLIDDEIPLVSRFVPDPGTIYDFDIDDDDENYCE